MKGEIINNLLHTSNLKWVKSKQLIMWTWTSQYSQEIEYSSSKLNGITTKTMRKNILKEISILRVVVYDENYPRSLCLSSCIQITHISISFIKIKKNYKNIRHWHCDCAKLMFMFEKVRRTKHVTMFIHSLKYMYKYVLNF